MRRFVLIATTLAIVGGSSLLQPAHAANPVTLTDAEGDATGFGPVPAAPNAPELDILGGSIAYDGKNFVLTAAVTTVAAQSPPPSTGMYFEWEYTLGDATFAVAALRGIADGDRAQIQGTDPTTNSGSFVQCEACKVKFDADENVVSVTISSAALSSSMRTIVPTAKSFKPGEKFTAIKIHSVRYIGHADAGYFNFPADTAETADELTF